MKIWRSAGFKLSITSMLAFFIVITYSVHADSAEYESNCSKVQTLEQRFTDMWRGGIKDQQTFLKCSANLWEENHAGNITYGDIDSEVFDLVTSASEYDPVEFFDFMDSRPAFFKAWKTELFGEMFYWHRDPPCQLEGRVVQLKRSFNARRNDLVKYRSYRDIARQLSGLRCRQVD
jgi:hypothetical protein